MNVIQPATLHDPVPFGYSHVVDSGTGLVAVAGQYASGPDGQVAVTGFTDQVELAFDHLRIALRAVGLDLRHVVRLGTHVVDHDSDRLAVVARHVNTLWHGRPPAQTLVGVASLAMPGMLFEVDALAVRGPNETRPTE
ncbi:RidA family protein [Spiractinospora alimapuensis]|uniref:RidA family protein n=1 Tax=Spiractinospora alimapuensis TaxID=2820884 RepID=UPI001F449F17|nr:RidA family protein [Spiractinospora alimapuensis]QVQ53808.1 RidA family protein [Spiractinospora alimapuensis]